MKAICLHCNIEEQTEYCIPGKTTLFIYFFLLMKGISFGFFLHAIFINIDYRLLVLVYTLYFLCEVK